MTVLWAVEYLLQLARRFEVIVRLLEENSAMMEIQVTRISVTVLVLEM